MDARKIISLWPSRSDLASDIGVNLGVVNNWAKPGRNRIAPEYDVQLVEAANERGLPLTFEDLARSRAPQQAEAS